MAGSSSWGACWARDSLMILMVNEAKRHDHDTKATHQKTSVNHESKITDLVGARRDRIVLLTASGSASSEVQKSAKKWTKA